MSGEIRDQKLLNRELQTLRTFFEARFTEIKGEIRRLVDVYTGRAPALEPAPGVAPAVEFVAAPPAPVADAAPVFVPATEPALASASGPSGAEPAPAPVAKAKPAKAKAAKAKPAKGAKGSKAKATPAGRTGPAAHAERLEQALQGHARARDLLKAGKAKDQLLRSLIPLYLAQGLAGVEVNSGAISAFWKAHGVSFAGPNAAKALRGHAGHVTKAGKGWAITDSGVRYVEAALAGREAA